jgi:hypothetical protein
MARLVMYCISEGISYVRILDRRSIPSAPKMSDLNITARLGVAVAVAVVSSEAGGGVLY